MNIEDRLEQWRDDFSIFSEDVIKIPDEFGTVIPFKFNRMQNYFWQKEAECREKKIPFWILVLKIRRAGSSYYWTERLFWKAIMNRNRNCMLRCQDDATSQLLFSIPKFSFKHLPDFMKTIMVKLDNDSIWQFANPHPKGRPGLESKIFCSTVGSPHAGAGYGIHDLLLAEIGRYDEVTDVSKMMTTIMQTVPYSLDTSVVGESTANGEGLMKAMWEDDTNGFLKEFISYVAIEKYYEEVDGPFELSAVDSSRYGNEEEDAEIIRKEILRWFPEWNAYANSSQIEQRIYGILKWRRMRIDRYCQGDKLIFDQEFPLTPERAFMLSGSSVFSGEVLTFFINGLKTEEKELKEKDAWPNYDRFRFDPSFDVQFLGQDSKARFDRVFGKSGFGPLFIYEHPIKGVNYGLGADPSIGIVGGDDAAISILRIPDRYEVAHYAKPTDPDLLADIIYVLGLYYNRALLGVEMNEGGGGGTVLSRLLRILKYPTSRIYREKHWDRTKVDLDKRYGWQSNSRSKDKLIGDYRQIVREEQIHFNSLDNLKEHKAYKYFPDDDKCYVAGPNGGKLSANRVIATALASLMVTVFPIYAHGDLAKPEKNSVKWWEERYGSFTDSPTRGLRRLHNW